MILLWLYYFDMVILYVFEGEGELMWLVGVGVSLGDGSYV